MNDEECLALCECDMKLLRALADYQQSLLRLSTTLDEKVTPPRDDEKAWCERNERMRKAWMKRHPEGMLQIFALTRDERHKLIKQMFADIVANAHKVLHAAPLEWRDAQRCMAEYMFVATHHADPPTDCTRLEKLRCESDKRINNALGALMTNMHIDPSTKRRKPN